jgi:hypothetical protein
LRPIDLLIEELHPLASQIISPPPTPPEPQITDPNPVPALMLWARRLQEADANEKECRRQALGHAFEAAVRAHANPEARSHITRALQEATGKVPRMTDFNSLLRHTVALVLSPQNPGAARKNPSFWARAMIGLPHTMKAKEVAEVLKTQGMRNLAGETAQRRAAQKASATAATITSGDASNEDQPSSPEPHEDDQSGPDAAVVESEAPPTNQPDWVAVTMQAEPHTVRALEAMPVGSPVAAMITRDASGKLRVEVASTGENRA